MRDGSAFAKKQNRHIAMEQPHGGENDAVEDGTHLGRRLTDDTQDIRGGGLPRQRLVALAGSAIELLLQIGNRGVATTHDLRRIAALWRCRFTASRCNRLAA